MRRCINAPETLVQSATMCTFQPHANQAATNQTPTSLKKKCKLRMQGKKCIVCSLIFRSFRWRMSIFDLVVSKQRPASNYPELSDERRELFSSRPNFAKRRGFFVCKTHIAPVYLLRCEILTWATGKVSVCTAAAFPGKKTSKVALGAIAALT